MKSFVKIMSLMLVFVLTCIAPASAVGSGIGGVAGGVVGGAMGGAISSAENDTPWIQFGLNDSIITNVSNATTTDSYAIEFWVTAVNASEPVSYEIYYYSGPRPDHSTYMSLPVASGSYTSEGNFRVQVPGFGNYYIRATNGTACDDEYIFLNIREEKAEPCFVWTREKIVEFEQGKQVAMNKIEAVETAISIAVGLESTPVGIAFSILFAGTTIAEGQYDLTLIDDLRYYPREGYSWQYIFRPENGQCNIYLRQYDSSKQQIGEEILIRSIGPQ